MSSFIKGLGLDLFDFNTKLISVVEEEYGDMSFCVSCLMWQAFNTSDTGVCLVALHHSLRHYYHVGMRLGYNLAKRYATSFIPVDAVEIREAHARAGNTPDTFKLNPQIVLTLIEQRVAELKKNCKNIYIVIDCLSDFLNLGVQVEEIRKFLQYMMYSYKSNSTLVMCTQSYEEDQEQNIIKNTLFYCSDLRLSIRSLGTGFSKEVTGSIEISKADVDAVEGWTKPQLYHYKTKDRSINVFLPGNISFSY